MDILPHHIDLVVKLGGSAITDKSKLETLNEEALQEAAKLIHRCLVSGKKCIIVHGAGSFGHHQAKQYNVNGGWRNFDQEKMIRKGFCLTRNSVLQLNRFVVSALIDEDIPAVGLSCCGTWSTSDGLVTRYDLAPVLHLLQQGFLPVLHGDCVLDDKWGCAILSGDTIIKILCHDLEIKRALYLSNVPGIYTSPPELPGATLVREIMVDADGKIVEGTIATYTENSSNDAASENCYDVTGGMTFKLKTAIEIVREKAGQTEVFVSEIGAEYAEHVCLSFNSYKECNGTKIFYHRK